MRGYNRHARCALDLARVTEDRNALERERNELLDLLNLGRDRLVEVEQRLSVSLEEARVTIDRIEHDRQAILAERDLARDVLDGVPRGIITSLRSIFRARTTLCQNGSNGDAYCDPPKHIYQFGQTSCLCGEPDKK